MADPPAPARPVPDLLAVAVPAGGSVLVAADLHLAPQPTPGRNVALGALAAALRSGTGPGALVLAGNTFADPGRSDGPAPVAGVLADHPRLVGAVREWADAAPERRVVVLPGDRDAHIGWPGCSRDEVEQALGATVARAVELEVEAGCGWRRVRVESGRQCDELSRVDDPGDPAATPLAHHLRREVIPAVAAGPEAPATPAAGSTGRSGRGGARAARLRRAGLGRDWLDGAELLDDPAAFPRFLASRLTYRMLLRWAWLLAVPVVVAVALHLPLLVLASARGIGDHGPRAVILAFSVIVELGLLITIGLGALRRTWTTLSGVSLGAASREPNRAARDRARTLIASGYHGVVSAHTCRAELTDLVGGFFANPGCVADVVTEHRPRVPGLGLPPAFLAHRQASWLVLEAGSELHVRLLLARTALPGASLGERLATHPLRAVGSQDLRPEVVGSLPLGESWPVEPSGQLRRRRVRRWASLFVAAAALVSLVSAFSEPLRDRLALIRQIVPIAVPEAAAALTALAGVALLVLARGVRRGQRRPWAITLALLGASAVTNVLKGVDVEEALVSLAVAGYLWLNRADFRAATDPPRLRKDLLRWAVVTALTVAAGTGGIELGVVIRTLVAHREARHPRPHHPPLRPFSISWTRALQATVERMVGVGHVFLPRVIARFADPTMAAAASGLALLLAAAASRPALARRRGATDTGADAARARARAVVTRHASGTLDYFALRPDKDFFFWGDTVVAYALHGAVCLVSPDPVGPITEREPAWRAFRGFADEHGWTVGVLGAGEEWLPVYRATGMRTIYVGDEAVVRTDRFCLEGGRFKGLRQAVNRVARHGYTVSFHDPADLDAELRTSLREVMGKSRRGDVERGFSMTLGRVFDPDDVGLLLAVVHAPSGEPVAFCQYVPAPGIDGYSLDLMRRDAGDHPNGLVDFAVVETIRHLAAEGSKGLGLNFATLRAVIAGESGDGAWQRAQAWVLRRMGGSMQIESLWRFNAKFDPDWLPRYAVYDAPENAVAVALAVARAESFWELPVIGRFLVPRQDPAGGAGRDRGGATGTGVRDGPGESVVSGAGDQRRHGPRPAPRPVRTRVKAAVAGRQFASASGQVRKDPR